MAAQINRLDELARAVESNHVIYQVACTTMTRTASFMSPLACKVGGTDSIHVTDDVIVLLLHDNQEGMSNQPPCLCLWLSVMI
jgi:hypothetical protein